MSKEISEFIKSWIAKQPESLRKSDDEIEGYWYTSKDGHASINLNYYFETLLEDFLSQASESLKKMLDEKYPINSFEEWHKWESILGRSTLKIRYKYYVEEIERQREIAIQFHNAGKSQALSEQADKKWISVDKELPKSGLDILVCTTSKAIYKGDRYGDKWRLLGLWGYDGDEWKSNIEDTDITHWMPLPEIPKQ